MRNNPLKVIIIILFSEILLVGYSFYYHSSSNAFVKEYLRFYTPDALFDFSAIKENTLADSLLNNYFANTISDEMILKRTCLSKIGPKKQNAFLTNPDIIDSNGKPAGKALDNFFKALLNQADTTIVRIAHYGDSQLEGDRVSHVVRDKFHQKFGGSGIGYVPMKDLSPVSYIRNSSGNWVKNSVFQDRRQGVSYGLSGTVAYFNKYFVKQQEESANDSSATTDTNPVKTGVYYDHASVALKMSAKYSYNSISFLYGNSNARCAVNIYNTVTGDVIKTDTLMPCNQVCFHKTYLGPFLNVKIEFRADQSPEFYGMYFDSKNGIQVDNYAIRGHSGDGLMLISDERLKEMLELTNTRLVIFQYGANMVPSVRSEKACAWMGDLYYKLFMKFKKAKPDISILVIGAGDMAHGSEGKYVSYSWLPEITATQKQAALKAGCAYWDLYSMMGGAGSILAWSEKKLAVTNGHFSGKGQEIVANEIVEALMIEYNKFTYQIRKNK